jgi:phage-related protein
MMPIRLSFSLAKHPDGVDRQRLYASISIMGEEQAQRKPLHWVGPSRDDIRAMPEEVKDEFGHALDQAQAGEKHPRAKPLKGFGGAGILEVVTDDATGTCRAVYTVKFSGAVYVLHVFQKKSRKGISTPKEEIERVKQRLKVAKRHHEEHYEKKEGPKGSKGS